VLSALGNGSADDVRLSQTGDKAKSRQTSHAVHAAKIVLNSYRVPFWAGIGFSDAGQARSDIATFVEHAQAGFVGRGSLFGKRGEGR